MSMKLVCAGIAALAVCAGGARADAAQRQDGTRMRFAGMDRNQDGVITRDEWQGSDRAFRRADTNADGVLSGAEVWEAEPGARGTSGEFGEFSSWTTTEFARLDRNGDGRISTEEWPYAPALFRRADRDNDAALTRDEFLGRADAATTPPRDFDAVDTNHDGVISRSEWAQAFGATERQSSRAYRAGYERGVADGREAGREDKTRRDRWDLEGQRELEQADAGFDASLGDRADYQAGYRSGFRYGYTQGFGPRR